MDISYSVALRNASRAWQESRPVDSMTLATLRRGEAASHADGSARDMTQDAIPGQRSRTVRSAMAPTMVAMMQPPLATSGLLGRRLNLFA